MDQSIEGVIQGLATSNSRYTGGGGVQHKYYCCCMTVVYNAEF